MERKENRTDDEIIDDVLKHINRPNIFNSWNLNSLSMIPSAKRNLIHAKLYEYGLIEDARKLTSSGTFIKPSRKSILLIDEHGSYVKYIESTKPKKKMPDQNEQLEVDVKTGLMVLYKAPQNAAYYNELLPLENVNDDRLEHLSDVLEGRGYARREEELVTLTEKGRKFIKAGFKEKTNPEIIPEKMAKKMETTKIHCNNCNHETSHSIIAENVNHVILPTEVEAGRILEFSADYINQVLKCNGCGETTLKKFYYYSEDSMEDFPENDLEFFPRRGVSSIQKEFSEHVPLNILTIYEEVVQAFNNDIKLLCAGGIRTIIEAICVDKKIKSGRTEKAGVRNNLEGKINGLQENDLITKKHASILHEHRFLGNKALHDLEEPSREELQAAIEIIGITINNIYELHPKGEELKTKKAERKNNKKNSED